MARGPSAGSALKLDDRYAYNEIVLEPEDEVILDRVWAKFAAEHPNYQSPPEQLDRLRTLSDRRRALYAQLPSREERQRRAAQMRERDRCS